jgi:NAD(P)-dependent dehydrogenase (short-subunit alcohol dehydrogenase family)
MKRTVFSRGSVAVVTGAASGIGRATCRYFASQGMKICMTDVAKEKLSEALREVRALAKNDPEDIFSHVTDVGDYRQMERLCDEVFRRFGKVNVLMNNAANFSISFPLNRDHWRPVMETNFFGVLYGIQIFVPKMLESSEPGLILNLGSKLGITNPPLNPVYNASKAAVKNLTESLEHELRNIPGCQLSTSLLIPGWTTTGEHAPQPGAWMPDQVVEYMMPALERGDFYVVCPDNEVTSNMDRARFLWAMGDIIENRPALSRWHPDYGERFEEPTG